MILQQDLSPSSYIQLTTTPCPLLMCRALKIINAWLSPSSACVLQRCTTPPSIALNLFLSSCLHCVVCTSWGHGAECIKMSALWHLSFAHSLKWNIPGDVTDGSWGLTLLKLSDAGILSRAAVTVQWDGEETSDHRVHSGSAGPIIIVTTHR